jgi:hypothetical protein
VLSEQIPADLAVKIHELGTADIVLSIPGFNSTQTSGNAVRAVQQALRRYFPSARSVIINPEGNSKNASIVLEADGDATPVLLLPDSGYTTEEWSTPFPQTPAKAGALRLVFELARTLQATTCAVIDSDLSSITPEWIQLLINPVHDEGFDFAAPCYLRHKFDGAITSSIVYPLTRALYGRRIRQPIVSEFCFSANVLDYYLRQDVWNTEVARYGLDLWVTTEAVCGGFSVCQVFMGAKPQNSTDPAADLSTTLAQVLAAAFTEIERNVSMWQKVRASEPVPEFGGAMIINTDPVIVDVGKMIESFRIGCKNLYEVWGSVMSPATVIELNKLSRRNDAEFRLTDEVWVRVIYDFALAYHLKTLTRNHLLKALTPIYVGWLASFILEMQNAGETEVEARLEQLCLQYERDKPYLISRWRWPDRFSP